jgi:hypothetical protein
MSPLPGLGGGERSQANRQAIRKRAHSRKSHTGRYGTSRSKGRRPSREVTRARFRASWLCLGSLSRYERSMKSNTARKSSFTLPAAEHAQVLRLRRLLKASSNTEVIRRSLRLLEESVSREELRQQFRDASARVRSSALEAVHDLDPLAGDGLEDA